MMTGPQAGDDGQDEREQWRAARRSLNQRRHELAGAAGLLYPGVLRVAGTGLLCRAEWRPDRPVDLDQVRLRWTEPAPVSVVDGASPASAGVRPPMPDGRRYPTYADAVEALDPPALFENRPLYRLLAADLADVGGGAWLDLARGWYFDSTSVTEALAHEIAETMGDGGEKLRPGLEDLPFRAAVGDPCDLARRPAGVAVSTLTLRRCASDVSFLLHWRDPTKVTHAGGLYQVIPVGIFQPADDDPQAEQADLSLWRTLVREFSEELLGAPEDYPGADGGPFRYEDWEFYRELTAAREAGRLRVWCLGLGVDPLSLAADILAVAVFDADVFDAAFPAMVAGNAEGRLVTDQDQAGFSFTEDNVAKFADGTEPMQAAGAAVLQLAWQHRATLLG
jgi:hypothetical protein